MLSNLLKSGVVNGFKDQEEVQQPGTIGIHLENFKISTL